MAAGLGFKTFTTGEVLTAADTNGYLMQGVLVFATAAARNAAITSPQEGQFAFTKDTNGLWYYDGAAWVASGATGDIEGVTAGVGISGGGTSGTVTVTNSMATAITTNGDVIYGTGSGTFTRLGIGSTSQVLTVTGGVPVWATPASGSTFVGCFAYMSANLNMSNGTETSMTLDLENYDTDGFHSNVTNNTRLTIPTGKSGYYLVQGQVGYDLNTTNRRITTIRKNNTSNIAQVEGNPNGASNVYPYFPITVVAYLAAADYVELRGWQNSGGTLAALAGAVGSVFSIAYLGA